MSPDVTRTERRRLAVLGSPIDHSRSPQLHLAAYRHLGLDWGYDRVEMTGSRLPAFISGLGADWRGLSVTMPVKHDIIPLLDVQHEVVRLTGACNTVLLSEGTLSGFNTDVDGIVTAFIESGVLGIRHAYILGAGATASSAMVAVARLGAERVTVAARSPQRAAGLRMLGEELGVRVDIQKLGSSVPCSSGLGSAAPDAIVSTLPNGAVVESHTLFTDELRREAVLFDVAYDPWPSSLARLWHEVGGRVVSGFEMLLHQAVMQVRVFAGGGLETPFDDESTMVAAMRAAALSPAL